MLAKRRICCTSGHKVGLLAVTFFLLISINGFLISLWCARTPLDNTKTDRNMTKIKHRAVKLHRSKLSYSPKDFYRMDETLNLPVKSDKKVETVSCDNYLGKPEETQLLSKDHWRFIDDGQQNETYIYSAYYDARLDPPSVKIFGISSGVTFDANPLPGLKFCYIWFKRKFKPYVMVASYEVIPETHGRIYAASIHHCVLPIKDEPYAVALSVYKCKRQHHFLSVSNSRTKEPFRNFTVCVTPFSFEFDNVVQLVEMVEMNKLFGANRFTFYNYSAGPRVTQVLERYASEGLVEVLEWNIPVNVDTSPQDPTVEVEIHYFGQLVSLNDCLYRNMFQSRFTVFSDLDEVIVPQMHENWYDMIRHAAAEAEAELIFVGGPRKIQFFPSSFLVRNIFLPLQWKENRPDIRSTKVWENLLLNSNLTAEDINICIKYNMNFVLATQCERESYNWYIRSKYIVWSKVAETVAVHQVNTFLFPQTNLQVQIKEHVALLHHYRNWNDKHSENSTRSCARLHHFIPQIYRIMINRLDIINFDYF